MGNEVFAGLAGDFPPLHLRSRALVPIVQGGMGAGIAKIGRRGIDTQLAAALGGDISKGLFFRGDAALPFGAEIRSARDLRTYLLTGIRPPAGRRRSNRRRTPPAGGSACVRRAAAGRAMARITRRRTASAAGPGSTAVQP